MSRHIATRNKRSKVRKDQLPELVRPRDLDAEGIPRENLRRLLDDSRPARTHGARAIVIAGSKPTPPHPR